MQAALSRLEAIEKPVIGALHRYVPGLGLELALAFDLRIATSDCELGLPEVRFGLVPDVGGTTRLVRTVGYAKAKELIMTGRMIPASEALALGLVNQVVPPGDHLAAAARLAGEIAANAPLAVGLAKKLIDLGHGSDKQTFLQMELLAQSILVRTDDVREGALAAAERLQLDTRLNAKCGFNLQDIEIFVNDRALVPNQHETRQVLEPEFRSFLNSLLGGAGYSLEFETDARRLFGVRIKAEQPVAIADLLANLARPDDPAYNVL